MLVIGVNGVGRQRAGGCIGHDQVVVVIEGETEERMGTPAGLATKVSEGRPSVSMVKTSMRLPLRFAVMISCCPSGVKPIWPGGVQKLSRSRDRGELQGAGGILNRAELAVGDLVSGDSTRLVGVDHIEQIAVDCHSDREGSPRGQHLT
jgi:hypothetical protein